MDEYDELRVIGEGAFGVVMRGIAQSSGATVAMKRVGVQNVSSGIPKSVLREIVTLRQLNHENIVSLLDVFVKGSSIYLVFEDMDTNLADVLEEVGHLLQPSYMKQVMYMILCGVAYCHSQGIIHRDVKPANILLRNSGVLKLADFGLARLLRPNHGSLTPQVASRWYRAPELLLGSSQYDTSVDMWSVGCIFAELFNGSVLFRGESDVDQLLRVSSVVGSPSEDSWPGVNKLPDFGKIMISKKVPVDICQILPSASSLSRDLMEQILILDPAKRIDASSALCHPFFFRIPLPICSPLPRSEKEELVSYFDGTVNIKCSKNC